MGDIARSIVVMSLLSVLMTFVVNGVVILVRELYREYKHRKYRHSLPEIIVDDGYGDIHRTVYPLELLAAKLFAMASMDDDGLNAALSHYMASQLHDAKKIRNKSKRRRYELITTHNIMTIIRRECGEKGK